MRVLVAPDKFKGCLTAAQVAEAIDRGMTSAGLRPTLLPLADGGDGTVTACLDAGFEEHRVAVSGPTGRIVDATIAFDGTTAVVELADTSGLARLPGRRLAPMTATTHGLGEAVLAALRLDPERIVVGLGGSAGTDGGTGMLSALGAHFSDRNGAPVALGGEGLGRIARIDLGPARELLDAVELVGATDVTSPLVGPDGAAFVFGPQKGASPAQVHALDAGLRTLAAAARFPTDLPGSGAAGGTGFALLLLGGTLVSGADFVLDLVGFDALVRSSDVVVTGEGRLDDQTRAGKLVGVVADRARAAGCAVTAVVGSNACSVPDPRLDVIALDELAGRSTAGDPAAAARALEQAGRLLGQRLLTPAPLAG